MLWGIAYGNITLWDGGTRGYIIWQNQIHIVYNIDRRIANSNILYVTLIFFFFFFWSYRISTISHKILVLVSFLVCLLNKNSSATSWKSRSLTSSVCFFFFCHRQSVQALLTHRCPHFTLSFSPCGKRNAPLHSLSAEKSDTSSRHQRRQIAGQAKTWCSALLMETCPIPISEPNELVVVQVSKCTGVCYNFTFWHN